MRFSDEIYHSVDEAIAECGTVADIDALSRDLMERYPEIRLNPDKLTEILVERATAKGLAVRFKGNTGSH